MILSQLKSGDSGLITRVDTTDVILAKLASRGIVPGAHVNILVQGNPCLITTNNDEWALSDQEASGIHVTRDGSAVSKLKSLFNWS